MVAYWYRVARYYNANVKLKIFYPGDLALRKAEISRLLDQEKLSSNWKRPYKVSETLHPGAYQLETLDGMTISQT